MSRDLLVASFDRLVLRRPRRAIILSPRDSITAGEVDVAAKFVSRMLGERGVEAGMAIGVVAPNGPGFLVALLACLRVGGSPVLIDDRLAPAEVARILTRLGADGWLRCTVAWPSGAKDFSFERVVTHPAHRHRIETPVVIKLTSGSTGDPRGILTPTRALLADDEALTRCMGIGERDRLVAAIPFAHSYGLSSLVVPALVRGTQLVLPDREGVFSPLDAARDLEATVFHTVPAYLSALLRLSDHPPLAESIRMLITAGAVLVPEVARRVRERYGHRVHVFYGASECGGIAFDPSGTAAERETVGTAVPRVRLDLRSVDGFEALEQGRIVVSSPAVARGYHPIADDRLRDGVFASNDVGRLRGGELTLVGRIDDLINVRGTKVNPTEVERVILEMPAVEEVKVLGVLNEPSGDQIVSAVVVARPEDVSSEEIRAWCRERLSGFKVPRRFFFVESIPRNDRGKLDRETLVRITEPMRTSRMNR